MEIVVIIILCLVGFSYLLKLTFHGWIGKIAICLVTAIFVVVMIDVATTQSKTRIADWIMQPDLMLDIAVLITLDVTFQICFCIMEGARIGSELSVKEKILYQITLWFPGILIFPMLFFLLTAVIFSLPGVDFNLVGWSVAAGVLVVTPLLSLGLKELIPEYDIRLELIFLVNILIAALGIVATVNGRTAAAGTNNVEWNALLGAIILTVLAAAVGFILYRHKFKSLFNKNS